MSSFIKHFPRKYACVANILKTRGYTIVHSNSNGLVEGTTYRFVPLLPGVSFNLNPLFGLAEGRRSHPNGVRAVIAPMFGVPRRVIQYFEFATRGDSPYEGFDLMNDDCRFAMSLGHFFRVRIFCQEPYAGIDFPYLLSRCPNFPFATFKLA